MQNQDKKLEAKLEFEDILEIRNENVRRVALQATEQRILEQNDPHYKRTGTYTDSYQGEQY